MPLIKLVNITKRFGKITALNDINLSVENGEYICILGPTGAGKTTLLRIIAGLLELDEGEVYIEGQLVNDVPPEDRNTVYMFQQFALFPHMDVWQNVSYTPSIKDWDNDKINYVTSEILEMVRLAERRDAYPKELSGGMQQRVALARGIASGARILLLDEPFGALDARLRVNLRSQLRALVKSQKLTTIHVTHDQEEALMTADRVVVLRNGRIEQIGDPNQIYSKPRSIFIANFVGGANFIEGNVKKVDDEGSLIEFRDDFQLRVSTPSTNVGEKVVVTVRHEDTLIRTHPVIGSNNFSCHIESRIFIGDSMVYVLKLENGITMSSKVLLSDNYVIHNIGKQRIVSFQPGKCLIFSYPQTGLLQEIEAV